MRARLLLIVIIGTLFGPLHAALTLDNVLDEMQVKGRAIRNIQFGFEQQVRFTEMSETTTVQGEAAFSKPGKLHIHKKFPDEQITVSNGEKIWIYTPSFNQVWEGPMKNWVGATLLPKGIIPLDNFADDLRKNFHLRLKEQPVSGVGLWLSATPKDETLDYNLELQISTTSWLPVKTIYRSESAEIVTNLTEAKVNAALPEQMFWFQAPKDADVIPLN